VAGLAEVLAGHKVVGLDTTVFAYRLEGRAPFAAPSALALLAVASGSVRGVTSALTLMELVVKPLQAGRTDQADRYEALVNGFPNLVVAELDRPTLRRAAELRALRRLRPIDALHLAACLQQGATAFLTNDGDFRRVREEVEVVLLSDFLASDRP
jgi:predicted nucleic acid-binding protein